MLVPLPGAGDGADPGPRLDYLEIARAIDGEVVYAPRTAGALGRIEARARRLGDWRQGAAARRSDARCFVSLSEKSALAPALLDGRRPHVAVAHRLTTPRRRTLQRWTRWLRRLDRVVVLSRPQERYLLEDAGLPPERVRFLHDKVDHRFFAPAGAPPGDYVLSVGQTQRDYATLFAALRDLRVPAVVVASSPWTGTSQGARAEAPPGVQVRRGLSPRELRDLYDRAALVVVPLFGALDFAAGVNGVLEAHAMRRPLVVTETPGLAGYVEDGRNARLVPPADPGALREAIGALLSDPAEASRLAAAGRAAVDGGRNLDAYVAGVAALVQEVAPVAGPPAPDATAHAR